MPKRNDISSIMIIGAGPIIIGQACEFDYSGAQACKSLKEEGYRIVLVNSNPATIMTDPEMADATYIEPLTKEFLTKIIAKEKPDALLPTMGGQTALNLSLELYNSGVLDEHGIELIGANEEAINKAEDRYLFHKAMDKIGLESPKSKIANSIEEALASLDEIGLPAIIRPAFTLGGTGGGIAYNKREFEEFCQNGLNASPIHQILIDESLLGWKEYEMEVVRDKKDNAIIICSIENVDPMGVHTGDSITVAPALTLTDKEYQRMRNGSLAVLREIGVETGGSNVQWAINPNTGRMVIIEMNPRVSRSSALASKATGFPIAKVAAKLAVGYTLDELTNEITGVTPASFEPTIDYVVTKIPRFSFEKFPEAKPELNTAMKSVGEVMAIGRTFHESVQKALVGLEIGLNGFDEIDIAGIPSHAGINQKPDDEDIVSALSKFSPDRLLTIAQAMRLGFTDERINQITQYDPWFLGRIRDIVEAELELQSMQTLKNRQHFINLKMMGFSDARIAHLLGQDVATIRKKRHKEGIHPVFKRIDTCAAEFESQTPYLYSTYEVNTFDEPECESRPTDRSKIVVLGGGPNRIGQGIEFDYCCCHACMALGKVGYETIMINCNPETVSTDYDTSDRLYFEPLRLEHVQEILIKESRNGKIEGVIVQLGGQTPLKLANDLEKAGFPILGTSPKAIDWAENREQFKNLLQDLGLTQPDNGTAFGLEQAREIAIRIGYPVVIRPSYVLGGRAMEIVGSTEQLEAYMQQAIIASDNNPVLIDKFLPDAIEVDVDAIADEENVYIAGIMEHIELAGIHSGDSACSLPPHTLDKETIDKLKDQTERLAFALKVKGLMNVQYAVQGKNIFVLEVNPRASRTVPFVAKVIGKPVASIAARVMAGEKLSTFDLDLPENGHFAVKEAVFPFKRFPGVDGLLGPEMKSTGEVMGLDDNFESAYFKAQLSAGNNIDPSGKVFISIKDSDKTEMFLKTAKTLVELGYNVIATKGTAAFLQDNGITCERVKKVYEGKPNILDLMKDEQVVLIMNTTDSIRTIRDSKTIRTEAIADGIPYYTTASASYSLSLALNAQKRSKMGVRPIQGFSLDRAGT